MELLRIRFMVSPQLRSPHARGLVRVPHEACVKPLHTGSAIASSRSPILGRMKRTLFQWLRIMLVRRMQRLDRRRFTA
jgi:hypothetical protein